MEWCICISIYIHKYLFTCKYMYKYSICRIYTYTYRYESPKGNITDASQARDSNGVVDWRGRPRPIYMRV
jgi:hypothetical protein